MAVDMKLTEPERRLILTVRALPQGLRDRLADYAASLRHDHGSADLGQPRGLASVPGTLSMTDDELREMGEFLRACEQVGMGASSGSLDAGNRDGGVAPQEA